MEIRRVQSPNKHERTMDVSIIVLHVTLGNKKSAISWLTNPQSNVSAHYVIGRLGSITELVPIDYSAWHAGRIYKPSRRAQVVLKKNGDEYVNPNEYSIGIEFAAGYDIDRDGIVEGWEKLFTPYQIKAGAELIVSVIEPKLKKVFSRSHIITHRDIASYKPNIELPRQMLLAELDKRRKSVVPQKPQPLARIKKGKYLIDVDGDDILFYRP